MTCPLPRPTPEELWNQTAARFSANVLGGAPIIPESNEWYVVANDVLAADAFHAIAQAEWRERDPRTACCDNLVDMAGRDGVYPRPALAARGYITISGTPGAALSSNLTVNIGSLSYQVFNPATIPATMPAGGSVTLHFVCTTAGVTGNALQSGQPITVVSPPAGINGTAVVAGNRFCGGREAETCEEFRTRYLERKRVPADPTFARLRDAALEWPCVRRVFRRGPLCCDLEPACPKPLFIHVLMDDTFEHGVAPGNIVDEITEYLYGAPYGHTDQGLGLGVAEVSVYGEVKALTAAPVSVVYKGVACLSLALQQEIIARTQALFAAVAPSTEICRNAFLGIVASLAPDLCDFDVAVTTTDPEHITVTTCGDIEPACDVRPYLANLTIR